MILDPPTTPYYSTVVQVRALYVLALKNDIRVQQRQKLEHAKFTGEEDRDFRDEVRKQPSHSNYVSFIFISHAYILIIFYFNTIN